MEWLRIRASLGVFLRKSSSPNGGLVSMVCDIGPCRPMGSCGFPNPRAPVVPSFRRCLGWVSRVQIPSEEVLGAPGNRFFNGRLNSSRFFHRMLTGQENAPSHEVASTQCTQYPSAIFHVPYTPWDWNICRSIDPANHHPWPFLGSPQSHGAFGCPTLPRLGRFGGRSAGESSTT